MDKQKIKEQIEFYFGNSNLPKDRFLKETIANDSDGYVPIETLLKFKRLKQLEATEEVIVEIFKDSEVLGISEDKKKIRRLAALPDVDDSNSRTCFCSGFPKTLTQLDAEKFFHLLQPGTVGSVRLCRKRGGDRPFVGCIYVEFKTAENMEAFIEKSKELKYEEKEIKVVTVEEKKKRKAKFLEKKKQNNKRKRSEEIAAEKLKEVEGLYKECLVTITKIPTGKELNFKGIKNAVIERVGSEDGTIFVDYPVADHEDKANIRLPSKESTEKFFASVKETPLVIGDTTVDVERLSEEESNIFLKGLVGKLLESEFEPARKKRKVE